MLPNVIIIGAAKCGTTSLHIYLDCHPEIYMSKPKELNFFSSAELWGRGVEWYESHFPDNTPIVGEASTNYTKHPLFRGVPERMHKTVPDAKLIYMVRDPIERMLSHYADNMSNGIENRSIEECMDGFEASKYFFESMYYMQLTRFLPYYDSSQIMVVGLEELRDNRLLWLQKIFSFLEVDESFQCDKFQKVFHRTQDKRNKNWIGRGLRMLHVTDHLRPVLPDCLLRLYGLIAGKRIKPPEIALDLRRRIGERIKPDVAQLREFTQKEFVQWTV